MNIKLQYLYKLGLFTGNLFACETAGILMHVAFITAGKTIWQYRICEYNHGLLWIIVQGYVTSKGVAE